MKHPSLSMTAINAYLRQLHPFLFVLLIVAVCFVFTMFLSAFVELFGIPDIDFVENKIFDFDIITQIFAAVIFAPLAETLIFQKWLYWLLNKIKYFRNNIYWIILISGVVFGSGHYYSVIYMIQGVFMGFFLMYAYLLRIDRHPYWTVAAIHALYNLVVIGLVGLLDGLGINV